MIEPYEKVKERLMEASDKIAREIIDRCFPMEADLSENRARQLYGDRWVRSKKASGELSSRRRGTKTLFRRAELDRLRAKEREPARLVFKDKTIH